MNLKPSFLAITARLQRHTSLNGEERACLPLLPAQQLQQHNIFRKPLTSAFKAVVEHIVENI